MTPWADRVTISGADLYLGDALQVIPALTGDVGAVVTDPPYSSGGAFRGDRMAATSAKYQSSKHRGRYVEFSGDNRDQRSYGYWCSLWLGMCLDVCRPGAPIAVFTDWRQLPTTTDAVQAGGWIWRGVAVWDKTEAARPQRGRYRNQAEYVVWGSKGSMGDVGPCLPGVFRHSSAQGERLHMAGKPVGLMAALLGIAPAACAVLDPFMGAASTGVAAMRAGHAFIGIESDPRIFETACRRLEKVSREGRLPLVSVPADAQQGLFAPGEGEAP